MEGLEDELTCPVCLELFTCPLQLPCHHNLCRRCAEVILQSETDPSQDDEEEATAACSTASPPGPEGTPDGFPCPTCREEVSLDTRGLDGLRKNLLLQNIVDRYMKLKGTGDLGSQQIPCQLCKEEPPKMASKSCLVCKVSYCQQCLSLTHPAFPPFTEHKLVSPRTSFDEISTVMCSDHPKEPVKMYCVQDQTPVCLLCEKVGRHKQHNIFSFFVFDRQSLMTQVGRHKQHNMAALEEVFSQRRADLQSEVDRLGAWVAEEEERVRAMQEKQEYVKTRAAEIKAQVTDECSKLCVVIQSRSTDMNHQVERAKLQDEENLARLMDKTKDAVHKARSKLAYAQEALKETDHASFLQTDAAVIAKLGSTVNVMVAEDVDITCEVDKIKVDLSQTKEMLQCINIGEPIQAPVILCQQCSATPNNATIKWRPVDGACEYEVQYGSILMATDVTKDHSFTAKRLTPGTKYTFEVRSKSETGTSAACSMEMVTATFPFQIDPNTVNKRFVRLSKENSCCAHSGAGVQTFLGDTFIDSGRHYWEVGVNSTSYSVGVAYRDILAKGTDIRRTAVSWAFDLDTTSYSVKHNCQKLFEVEEIDPSKIGVLVDYDSGQLSFYNADTQTLMYTHRTSFTQPLYPAFSLWKGSLRIHSGLVCPY
ncbi:E3 ubiquitin-protein ligase Midline-1-like [Branchiostoma lanceolatum]|uniref:E3 ubiquitin-protein ligase Midline-1-like n=1 Tax=Branchiostoma lanceolatum TaxID=7740 RepID=UPI0034555E4D